MKLLAVLILIGLAAALPVAEPESNPEADPSYVYLTGLTYPHATPLTTHPYPQYSGYPTVYSTGHRFPYSHQTYPYTTVYGRKKRSADPEPQPQPAADPNADPSADPSVDPSLVYTTAGLNYPYVNTYNYPYTTYGRYPYTAVYSALPHTYTHAAYPTSYTAVVQGRKKRSADPEPQPEAEADPQLVYTSGYPTLPAVIPSVAGTYSYPYVSSYPYTYPLTYGASAYPTTVYYG